MVAKVKHYRPCSACGGMTRNGKKPGRPVLCHECGVAAAIAAARQMSRQTGPAWSNWLASNARGAPGARARQESE